MDSVHRDVRTYLVANNVDMAARTLLGLIPSSAEQGESLRTILDQAVIENVGTLTLLGFFERLPAQVALDGLEILHTHITTWSLARGPHDVRRLQINCPKLPIVRFLQRFKEDLDGEERLRAERYWDQWATPVVRAIINESEVVVKYKHEYLYAPIDYYMYDDDRRRVFTWKSNWTPDEDKEKWRILQPNVDEDRFVIQSANTREYMYATEYASIPDDAEGRRRSRVFLWRPKTYDEKSFWQLLPLPHGEFALYNCYREEFLYASSETWDNDERRHVWTKNNCEEGDTWKWKIVAE